MRTKNAAMRIAVGVLRKHLPGGDDNPHLMAIRAWLSQQLEEAHPRRLDRPALRDTLANIERQIKTLELDYRDASAFKRSSVRSKLEKQKREIISALSPKRRFPRAVLPRDSSRMEKTIQEWIDGDPWFIPPDVVGEDCRNDYYYVTIPAMMTCPPLASIIERLPPGYLLLFIVWRDKSGVIIACKGELLWPPEDWIHAAYERARGHAK